MIEGMHPSTALARVLVDELVRGGVREAVLSPGSRSAPLAFALADAEVAGRLRLHVRIDERSAAFLALGLAKASGRPVPVVTTSGTATANLHPAVLEADLSGVPLLLLTADRPPELRGTGANQTVDQLGLYGSAVRLFVELGTPGTRVGDVAAWRSRTCRVLAAALGELGTPPGPVHVNLGLREPLVPDGADDWAEPLDGRPAGAPWTARVAAAPAPAPQDDLPARTVVVLGDGPRAQAAAALSLAPVAAGRRGRARRPVPHRRPGWLLLPELLLSQADWVSATPPRPRARRRPADAGRGGRTLAAAPRATWWPGSAAGPTRTGAASRVLPAVPAPPAATSEPGWLDAWLDAGAAVDDAVTPLVEQAVTAGGLVEPVVAGRVAGAVAPDGLLVVGSSKPCATCSSSARSPGRSCSPTAARRASTAPCRRRSAPRSRTARRAARRRTRCSAT
jgi:2-succinyl-5-enolpyruvyl-6-hydroxy-3-cyclohexene-1-carboxylate synthase